MIRVLLVDDHPLFRKGVAELLAEADGFEVTGQADDGLTALRIAETSTWDVAIVDLSLPRVSGPELLRRLREQFPDRAVLILSQYPAEQVGERMRREGATGYVSKSSPPDVLLAAIRAAAAGTTLPPESPAAPAPQLPHERLSAREYQVFTLVCLGRSSAEIAAELDLAPPTVSTHLKNVREKLGVRTVPEIVVYAHRAGLVS